MLLSEFTSKTVQRIKMHDGSMDLSYYGRENRPIDMSIQSPWHYYKVQKQLQLYMEEFTVLLHFDEISAIW